MRNEVLERKFSFFVEYSHCIVGKKANIIADKRFPDDLLIRD